jgi:hypothetical protein
MSFFSCTRYAQTLSTRFHPRLQAYTTDTGIRGRRNNFDIFPVAVKAERDKEETRKYQLLEVSIFGLVLSSKSLEKYFYLWNHKFGAKYPNIFVNI